MGDYYELSKGSMVRGTNDATPCRFKRPSNDRHRDVIVKLLNSGRSMPGPARGRSVKRSYLVSEQKRYRFEPGCYFKGMAKAQKKDYQRVGLP